MTARTPMPGDGAPEGGHGDVAAPELYRMLAENVSDVVFAATPDAVITWVSPSIEALLGWQPSKVVGLHPLALVHPDDAEVLAGRIAEVAGGTPVTFSARFRAAAGDYRWVQVTVRPVLDDAGRIVARVGTWRDIEHEVEAERRAREEGANLRATLDALLDPHVLLRAVRDEQGEVVDFVYVEANPIACEYLGRSREVLLGSRLLEIFPSQRGSLFDRFRACVESGRPLRLTDDSEVSAVTGTRQWFDFAAAPTGESLAVTWRNVTEHHDLLQRAASSETRLRLVAENAGDFVLTTDAEGVVDWVSPAVADVLGWEPAELLGLRGDELTHPADLRDSRASRERVMAGETVSGRIRVLTRSGAYRWIRRTIRPMRDADGHVVGRVSSCQDISREVEAEQALETERTRLQATLDSMLDPHVVMAAVRDDAGRIVDFVYAQANPAALAYLGGLTRDQFVGTRLRDMYPSGAAELLLAQYARTVDTGEPLVLDDYAYPNELFAGEERRYDLRGARVGDSISLTWRDVTDRHRTRARLEESEARYRLLAEHVTDVLLQSDDHGRIVYASPSARSMLGWEPDQLVGRTMVSLLRPEEAASLRVRMHALADTKPDDVTEVIEAQVATSDGGWRWVGFVGRPLRDADGTIVGGVDVLRDITAEVDARERLERAEEQYRLVAENATDAVFRTDADHRIIFCTDGVTRVLGWTPAEVVGRLDTDFLHPDDVERARGTATRDGALGPVRLRLRTAGDGYRWVEASGQEVRDESGAPVGLVGGWRDVNAEVEAQQELARRARTDVLTGLLNRDEVMRRLDAVLGHPPRSGSSTAVLYLDLDGLKEVNDERGHAAGDLLLRTTAERIREQVRADDLVARIGGDELLVVLTGIGSPLDAVSVADKLSARISAPIDLGDASPMSSTVSIGVALADPGDDVDAVIARADRAMYRAKAAGGNATRESDAPTASPRSPDDLGEMPPSRPE